jgi:hypothetical protein
MTSKNTQKNPNNLNQPETKNQPELIYVFS